MEKILIAVENKGENDLLKIFLQEEGYNVVSAITSQEGIDCINNYIFDVVISNIDISNSDDFEVLRTVKEISPETMVVIITDLATSEASVDAIKLGAEDYIKKPYKIEEIRLAVRKAIEKRNRFKELKFLKRKATEMMEKIQTEYHFQDILVKSPIMQQLIKTLPKIASSSANILIKGEVGSGREYLANTIHKMSPRSNSKFVSIHCADDQLEGKLFGYAKGVRENASSQQGLFEIASGGSIFLDQITELPLPLQIKLFIVLKDGAFRRIGTLGYIKHDVRIICTSSKDLSKAVSAGAFRADLFYRLNLIPVNLPPLRERKEDIPSLIRLFLNKLSTNKIVSPDAMKILTTYPWKGNLRELESVVERIVLFSDKEVITPTDIPAEISMLDHSQNSKQELDDNEIDLDKLMDKNEKDYLMTALKKAGGNKTEAAKMLNISFRSFRHRLFKYEIK